MLRVQHHAPVQVRAVTRLVAPAGKTPQPVASCSPMAQSHAAEVAVHAEQAAAMVPDRAAVEGNSRPRRSPGPAAVPPRAMPVAAIMSSAAVRVARLAVEHAAQSKAGAPPGTGWRMRNRRPATVWKVAMTRCWWSRSRSSGLILGRRKIHRARRHVQALLAVLLAATLIGMRRACAVRGLHADMGLAHRRGQRYADDGRQALASPAPAPECRRHEPPGARGVGPSIQPVRRRAPPAPGPWAWGGDPGPALRWRAATPGHGLQHGAALATGSGGGR